MNTCLLCGLKTRSNINTYCSNKCQSLHKYNIYIEMWKSGNMNGSRGKITKNISAHVKRYLFKKFGSKCVLCEWEEVHPITKRVPLEIDHIDGNSENNSEDNLRLLCPNCHSLSINYRNLNKGKGRTWRTTKYIKNT